MTIYLVMIGDWEDDTVDSAFVSMDRAEERRLALKDADKAHTPHAYYIVDVELTE